MKKIVLFAILIFTYSSICAQDSDKVGIYYKDTKLNYSRIGGKKVGNIAGAYFTFGLSSAKASVIIEGKHSLLEINETKPDFEFCFGEKDFTEYLFAKGSNTDNFILVLLEQKGQSRNLKTGKYGLTGVTIGVDQKYVIPIQIERIDENRFLIKPKVELKKGEYAFYYIGEVPIDKSPFKGVFDFSIK